jgi:exopolysaccharide biosynthesis polyprenyl glycosylphosphotransferase
MSDVRSPVENMSEDRTTENAFNHVSVPLQIGERKVVLLALDLLMLLAGAVTTIALWSARLGVPFASQLNLFNMKWMGLMAALWLVLTAANNLYSPRVAGHPWLLVRRLVTVALLVLAFYLLVYFVSHPGSAPRYTALVFGIAVSIFAALGRIAYLLLLGGRRFRRRALVVGADERAVMLLQTLLSDLSATYVVVGFVDREAGLVGSQVAGLPVLGTPADLPRLVGEMGITDVVLGPSGGRGEGTVRAILDCYERGVAVIPGERLYEEITGRIPLELMGDQWERVLPLGHLGHGGLYGMAKRCLDVAMALVGLFVFAVLFPAAALAIYLESGGPIFYRQARVGFGGRIFQLVKLRTMVKDAEAQGAAVWATVNDPRVTRVGRILRALMVDEFPQFYNVLRGDMSMVGPRPERPELVADLEKHIPLYRTRHSVRPGMAGWALANAGYGRSVSDALVKLQYDLYYIKHQSQYLDLLIILKTIGRALLLRRGETVREHTG